MTKSYIENSLKRFLKRKVKITLGLVVAFMITGTVGYGVTEGSLDPIDGDINYKVMKEEAGYTIQGNNNLSADGNVKLEFEGNWNPESTSRTVGVISTKEGDINVTAGKNIDIIGVSNGTTGIDGIGVKDNRANLRDGKVNLTAENGYINIETIGQQDVSGVATYNTKEVVTLTAKVNEGEINGQDTENIKNAGNIVIKVESTKMDPITFKNDDGSYSDDATSTIGINSYKGKIELTGNNIYISSLTRAENSIGISSNKGTTILTGKEKIEIIAKNEKGNNSIAKVIKGVVSEDGGITTLNSKEIYIEAKTEETELERQVYALFSTKGAKGEGLPGMVPEKTPGQNILTATGENGITLKAIGGVRTAGIYAEGETTNTLKSEGKIYIESIGEKTSYGIYSDVDLYTNIGADVDTTIKISSETDTIIKSTGKGYSSDGIYLRSSGIKNSMVSINAGGQIAIESTTTDGTAYGVRNSGKGNLILAGKVENDVEGSATKVFISSQSEKGTAYGIVGMSSAENRLKGTNISIIAQGKKSAIGIYGNKESKNILSAGEKGITINAISNSEYGYGISSDNSETNITSGKNITICSSGGIGSYGVASWNGSTLTMGAKDNILIDSKTTSGTSYGTFLVGDANLATTNSDGVVQVTSSSDNGIVYGIYGASSDIDINSNVTTIANSTKKEAYGILTKNSTLDVTGDTKISVLGKPIDTENATMTEAQRKTATEALAYGNNTISKVLSDANGVTGAVTQGIRAFESTMTYNGGLFVESSDVAMTSIGKVSPEQDSNITVNGGSHFKGNNYLIDLGESTNRLIARPVVQALDGGNITLNGGTIVESLTSENDESDHIANVGIYAHGHTDMDSKFEECEDTTTSEINITGDTIIKSDIAIMSTSGGHVHINKTEDGNPTEATGKVNIYGDIVAGKHNSDIDIGGTEVNLVGEIIGANGGHVNLDMSNGGYFEGRADDYFDLVLKNDNELGGSIFRNDKFSMDITSGGTVTLQMDNGAKWEVIGQSYVTNLNFGANGGTVSLGTRGETTNRGSSLSIETLSGTGTFDMYLNSENKENGNMLYIYETGSNNLTQNINLLGDSVLLLEAGERLRFATVGKDAQDSGINFDVKAISEEGIKEIEFNVGHNNYNGDKENDIYNGSGTTAGKPGDDVIDSTYAGGENWYITLKKDNKINDIGTTIIEMSRANYASAVYMDNLNKRLGDMSFVNGNEGLWVRLRNDRVGEDDEYRLINYMTQIGYDKVYPLDEGQEHRGIAVDYTQGEMDYKNINGESNIDRYTLTAYDTRMYNSGAYADYVARVGYMESDFEIYGRETGNKAEGDYDNLYLGLSAEFGKRYDFDENNYFEPQVQVQYTYIDDADYTTNQNTKVDYDEIHSLIGRAGFRLGHDFYNEEGKDNTVYVKADINHEFLGDQDVKATDRTGSIDKTYHNDTTWFDIGVGGAKNLTEDLYVYADVERQFGEGKDNKSWQFNVGFRYKF